MYGACGLRSELKRSTWGLAQTGSMEVDSAQGPVRACYGHGED